MAGNATVRAVNSSVWVPKSAVLKATKSMRIKAWANSFAYWIPGSVQRNRGHQTRYQVYFRPTPWFGRIALDIPAEAINIDVRHARKLFKAGPSITTYDQAWDIVKKSS